MADTGMKQVFVVLMSPSQTCPKSQDITVNHYVCLIAKHCHTKVVTYDMMLHSYHDKLNL